MQFIPHKSAFRITGSGKAEFTIIPNGYDWYKAVNVTVEVE